MDKQIRKTQKCSILFVFLELFFYDVFLLCSFRCFVFGFSVSCFAFLLCVIVFCFVLFGSFVGMFPFFEM